MSSILIKNQSEIYQQQHLINFEFSPKLCCLNCILGGNGPNRGAYFAGKSNQTSLIEGAMQTSQFVDNIRHIYLGKKPFIIKECTRCTATSLPISSYKKALNKGWDLRWASKCPCGGPWKLSCLDDSFGLSKRTLLNCI